MPPENGAGTEPDPGRDFRLPPEADYRDLTVNEGISAHLLDHRLLLFSRKTQTLHELNDTAAFLWLSFTDGVHPFRTVRELVDTFHIGFDRAAADMASIFAQWVSLGLLRHKAASDAASHDGKPEDGQEPSHSPVIRASPESCWSEYSFVISGHVFTIRFSEPEQEDAVWPIFCHLQVEESSVDSCIDVVREHGGHTVLIDGIAAGSCSAPSEIGHIVSKEALKVAYRSVDSLIVVHAGVVARNGRCVLIPGPSGAGKTTITAGLVSAGYCYFTDEIAIVERETRLIVPCAVSLSVKDGSWDAVVKTFKGEVSFCTTSASDGARIRYLRPPPGSFALGSHESLPVGAMVFPRYSPNEPTAIRPISRIEALRGIQDAGFGANGELDSEKVGELVAWLSGIRCYELVFGSLPEAIVAMRGVLA